MYKYAVISFIPAIHKGYIDLFRKYKGVLYILGNDFINDFPPMERDMRTPDIEDLKKIISSLNVFDEIIELNRDSIKILPKDLKLVMPEDSVTRSVADKYMSNKEIIFDTTFLRWSKQISQTEFQVSPDQVISEEERDRELMEEAFKEANKSSDWWRRVGAVSIKDKKIIDTGFNTHLPSDFTMDSYGDPRSDFDAGERFDLASSIHAEASLIAKAANKGNSLKGSSIYVTTFPCPSCAKLIVGAGIKKVYYSQGYSLLDAEQILKSFKVDIILVR